jgi:hypothetical protein
VTIADPAPLDGIPELPARVNGNAWSSYARDLWLAIWGSAQAKFWTGIDVHRIVLYVRLMERAWLDESMDAMREARLQGARLGIVSLDRNGLGWIVTSGEKAKPQAPPRREPGEDPRKQSVLRAVK